MRQLEIPPKVYVRFVNKSCYVSWNNWKSWILSCFVLEENGLIAELISHLEIQSEKFRIEPVSSMLIGVSE